MIQRDFLFLHMFAYALPGPSDHWKMDDATLSIRQYVAALSRLLVDFDDGENGRCDGCRVNIILI
ncbi:uncharacterized protein METZ01_LOCUS477848 [marine metagenome]|uniref:Uncharacterized protein n=1 Tax=marine metagenome TaxID=408172 RepID=A0A383BYK1_9ZZZZ